MSIATLDEFPGYDISDDGVVYSRWHQSGRNIFVIGKSRKLLAGHIDLDGYRRVTLKTRTGGTKTVGLHTLVLTVFRGPCPTGMQACHNDGVKSNNALSNLRWDTCASNIADKRKHGTHRTGERHGRAKLTHSEVAEIRRRYESGEYLLRELAAMYGVSKSAIGAIVNNQTYQECIS